MGRHKKPLFSRHFIRLLLALVLVVVVSMFGAYAWFPELLTHFVAGYILVSLLLAVGLLLLKRRGWALIAVAVCVFEAIKLVPFWQEPDVVSTKGANVESVKILQYNVGRNNDRVNDMARWITSNSENADIVVLFEITDTWQIALERVKWSYPYHITKEVRGNRRIVVLSKLLIDELEVMDLAYGESGVVIRGATTNFEIPFVMYSIHPAPPLSPAAAKRRNAVLKEAGERIEKEAFGHKILVGDLNVTHFSPVFEQLMKDSKLYDTNQGIDYYEGTWPSFLPRILGIPIDNMLVSKWIKTEKKQLGPAMGSDHRPVITNLTFIAPEEGE